MKVTYVVPGNSRAGGIRVTVIMANILLFRGYSVRIVYRNKISLRKIFRAVVKGVRQTGWLHLFKGKIETYRDINDIRWVNGELVIGVGTFVVPDLCALKFPGVIKIRSNHGVPADLDSKIAPGWTARKCWTTPMKTITVSKSLIPRIESLCNHTVSGVIHNGIDTSEYFIEDGIRDGVGTIYYVHPNKAPEDTIQILRRLKSMKPQLPQYAFGMDRKPHVLRHVRYTMLPKVSKARKIYNSAKIWIIASHEEGFPAPVLEAMACGCVVVSSDNDGSLEIIKDGYNGIIVPRGDISTFVAEICNLLDDPAKIEYLKCNSRETVKKYTWGRAADTMDEFLKSFKGPK